LYRLENKDITAIIWMLHFFSKRTLVQPQRIHALSASRLLRQAAAKGQFGFHPFLPKPMAGLGNIAAPQRIVCSARERFLHLHSLRGQKAGLSAYETFIQTAANVCYPPNVLFVITL
jgi:hypothetical protein